MSACRYRGGRDDSPIILPWFSLVNLGSIPLSSSPSRDKIATMANLQIPQCAGFVKYEYQNKLSILDDLQAAYYLESPRPPFPVSDQQSFNCHQHPEKQTAQGLFFEGSPPGATSRGTTNGGVNTTWNAHHTITGGKRVKPGNLFKLRHYCPHCSHNEDREKLQRNSTRLQLRH